MARFYDGYIVGSGQDLSYFVMVMNSSGCLEEVEVSRRVFDEINELQREFWRIERKEARHSVHLDAIPECYLPQDRLGKSSEQVFFEQIESAEIEAALARIPAIQRRRFLMRYLMGLTVRQIADLEGCSPRAILFTLSAARKNLRGILAEG